ncbi:hypothetical protein A2Z22_02585 [Candidatus Woesebacteria bacterium RBG_16_34_12]|uniref:GH18 domain-containing protein n=1 Tax=Candidatus Woesebacteria bacterium RBG_16_34_12 TaxID=1802480 RepID=A0A1F7X8N1_9BACT|nr:MAG: hypothetical protein A2Z22_02585 [Candidatus Woesebacteria bacterium RBG_16_34_12]
MNGQKGAIHLFLAVVIGFFIVGMIVYLLLNSKSEVGTSQETAQTEDSNVFRDSSTPAQEQSKTTTGDGIIFGPFHLPDTMFGNQFTGAFISLRPLNAKEVLDGARKANISLMVNLAGGRNSFQNEDDSFSVDKFKSRIDQYKEIDFDSYVNDGTLIGHLMFDEPQDPNNWNGLAVSFSDIDEAAKYSKDLWPNLPVGVGGPPTFLKNYSWSYLDFGFAQYVSKRGNVVSWKNSEVNAAKSAGLGLVLSINVLGGNNGAEVTSDQLKDWGEILASDPYACALLMWKFDENYFSDSDVMSSVDDIVEVSNSQTSTSCKPKNIRN